MPSPMQSAAKEDHRELHVPWRVWRAQSRVLLKEHEPRELDPGVQEDAGRGGHQQEPASARCSSPAAWLIIDLLTKPEVQGKEEMASAPTMPHTVVTGML